MRTSKFSAGILPGAKAGQVYRADADVVLTPRDVGRD